MTRLCQVLVFCHLCRKLITLHSTDQPDIAAAWSKATLSPSKNQRKGGLIKGSNQPIAD